MKYDSNKKDHVRLMKLIMEFKKLGQPEAERATQRMMDIVEETELY